MGDESADLVSSREAVTAVIVTHNPQLNVLVEIINRIASQVSSIIVVDNNSKHQGDIERVCEAVELCLLPANLGLGKAQNLGIEYAISQNSDYVLILDQDSLLDANAVAEMLKSAKQIRSLDEKFCALGVRYRDDNKNLSNFVKVDWFGFGRRYCANNAYVKADFLISSGSLISLSAIAEIGMMDESLFIDHVDTEWFMRAQSLGYQAYGCCSAFMRHGLGERTSRIWFLRWRSVPCHKPFRYFYIFRNSINLYKRNYLPLKWKTADLVRLVQMFVFFAVLSENRSDNFRMIMQGILAGMKGKSGRNDELKTAR